MLDPWIIEEILRREEQERLPQRPFLEVPLDPEDDEREQEVRDDEEERGVVIIDYRL